MAETADFVVVGAGAVGLAVARALRGAHPAAKIVVLEKEDAPGRHASGRNSGVLHSGVYYPPQTLKARFCAEGARRWRVFAEEKKIPCRQGGKVILAGTADGRSLAALEANARAGGVRVEALSAEDVRRVEPHAAPRPGLWCRDTAVIDAAAATRALAEDLARSGVAIRTGQRALDRQPADNLLRTEAGETFSYGRLYNCAGAHADRLARAYGVGAEYALIPFKGLYMKLRPERASLVRESLYPVPDPAFPFLGVHLTRSVAGDVYVGPTAIPAFGAENYRGARGVTPGEFFVTAGRLLRLMAARDGQFRRLAAREMALYLKPMFVAAARRLVPDLRGGDLEPTPKAGIRPQLVRRADRRLEMDFVIRHTPATTHVLNAISPAFTSAFPFGEFVVSGAAA